MAPLTVCWQGMQLPRTDALPKRSLTVLDWGKQLDTEKQEHMDALA